MLGVITFFTQLQVIRSLCRKVASPMQSTHEKVSLSYRKELSDDYSWLFICVGLREVHSGGEAWRAGCRHFLKPFYPVLYYILYKNLVFFFKFFKTKDEKLGNKKEL